MLVKDLGSIESPSGFFIPLPVLNSPSPAQVSSLSDNIFFNGLAPKVAKSIVINTLLCSSVSLSIALMTSFSNTHQSSRILTIFSGICISSFDITTDVASDSEDSHQQETDPNILYGSLYLLLMLLLIIVVSAHFLPIA